MIARLTVLLRRWWNVLVERDLSRDAQSREERTARVRRLEHEVRSLERAVRRSQ